MTVLGMTLGVQQLLLAGLAYGLLWVWRLR